MSIYEQLGGEAGVNALLDGLYVRALADPLLAPFLARIDVERLKASQFVFISQAIGGPHRYTGPGLTQGHARLQIEQRHFDAFLEHMRGSLREMGASDDLTNHLMSMVEPLSAMIVNTHSGATAT